MRMRRYPYLGYCAASSRMRARMGASNGSFLDWYVNDERATRINLHAARHESPQWRAYST
jgi:hypothetical protein